MAARGAIRGADAPLAPALAHTGAWPGTFSEPRSQAPNPLVPALDELLCPAGRHAGLGEITLGPHEHAIKVLFHSTTKPAPVNLGISAIYALFSFALGALTHGLPAPPPLPTGSPTHSAGVLTYGLPVPSGLFVPAIMAGGGARQPKPRSPSVASIFCKD